MYRRNQPASVKLAAYVGATLLLASCSGNGGVGVGRSSSDMAAAPVAAVQVSPADAVRLQKQASFGPTKAVTDHITSVGVGAWLEEQFASTTSSYAELAAHTAPRDYCKALTGAYAASCNRDYFSGTPVAMRFYANAMGNDDQLRQRVAFALSELMVASDLPLRSSAGLATINQIFLANAFGNYKDALQAVTLNPYMGSYLNMADSSRSAPNENYAREMMQLFSIGVNLISMDGSLQTDANGSPIAAYTPADVHDVARSLTGWTYARLNGAPLTDGNNLDYSHPMVVRPGAYDTTAKTFLGTTIAANTDQLTSVKTVVNTVFNHPNTPPFVSRFLIQQLVTSNPSPSYVRRVASVFANDGMGVRGDLKAVVKAILTDVDARGPAQSGASVGGASAGKVKEPVLLLTSIGRLIGDATDGWAFTTRDMGMGEEPFAAPSVFNFYPPDYPLPLGGALLSPPSKLISTATAIARHNVAYDWTVNGDFANRPEYVRQVNVTGATGTSPNWTFWDGFGPDVGGMINAVDLLMLNGAMTPTERAALTSAVMAVTNADPVAQAHKRAQTALYIVASSPQFQVDR